MSKKSDRKIAAFHARQAARNRSTPPVDSNIVTKKFKPALPEEDPT